MSVKYGFLLLIIGVVWVAADDVLMEDLYNTSHKMCRCVNIYLRKADHKNTCDIPSLNIEDKGPLFENVKTTCTSLLNLFKKHDEEYATSESTTQKLGSAETTGTADEETGTSSESTEKSSTLALESTATTTTATVTSTTVNGSAEKSAQKITPSESIERYHSTSVVVLVFFGAFFCGILVMLAAQWLDHRYRSRSHVVPPEQHALRSDSI